MPLSVLDTVDLPTPVLKFLVADNKDGKEFHKDKEFVTKGGIISNTDYAWMFNGPHLEVIKTKTGAKIGFWTFGWVLKDFRTEIICVNEIQRPNGKLPLLIVALDCKVTGSMICIFDFIRSKVIRAIHLPERITSLHVIDSGYDVFTLPGPLRSFDGIVAVGTEGGDVFLIDLCRQTLDEGLTSNGLNEFRDELNPCNTFVLSTTHITDIELQKESAIRNNYHLSIHLNAVVDNTSNHFTLKGPKGEDRLFVEKEEVEVSALYYCPQLGSILIGYNFGAFQLFNLVNLKLVYTSPVSNEHIPISHFAIQEPADDPKAYCYVWAVYDDEGFIPLAVMYAFCYQTKEYHEGYGILYQGFNLASVRFQMELMTANESNKISKSSSGRCLRLNTIQKGSILRENFQSELVENNLSLCFLAWSIQINKQSTESFICIFDLNQWYKEQMPSVPDKNYYSTYMIQYCISDLFGNNQCILDVNLPKNSLQPFVGAQRLDEHFCPNSLSFKFCVLSESNIICCYNQGVQKSLLMQIESIGPLCLIEPAEIYQQIIGLGLMPLFLDLSVTSPISTNQQREIILSTALEHQLKGWLCKCASEWANGNFLSTGCTLDFIVSWAFQRATTLKTNSDNFCVPLFDYSQARLDARTNNLLNNCVRQLRTLCSFYFFVAKELFRFLTNPDIVDEQYRSLQTVTTYFEALQWLLNVGLLPECPPTAHSSYIDLDRMSVPYPAEILTNYYNERRGTLKILNEEQFLCKFSPLFIDNLIDNECKDETLQTYWRKDGGNGFYPPPSLQSLLRTYLVDADLSFKHSIVFYMFLDLATILEQERYKLIITHLIKFPSVFKVSSSLIKITQAFWQLDHGDINTAMGFLLDPLILTADLKDWHHRIALRLLMLQKEHNFALLYLQIRKPIIKNEDDIYNAISLFVANGMLDEAFYFEKNYSKQSDDDKYLLHLFKEATKNDKTKSIMYRKLDLQQEKLYLDYLLKSKSAVGENLHICYHILRSHYIEAFDKHRELDSQGLSGQLNAMPRDKVIHHLKNILPDISRNLLTLCKKEKNYVWKDVVKSTPMSIFVHNAKENVQYKSTLIRAALAKSKQISKDKTNSIQIITEETPFLRTPTYPQCYKRKLPPIVEPKIIDPCIRSELEYSTPAKRMKLSPSSKKLSTPLSVSKLYTPLVKRKTPKTSNEDTIDSSYTTPHSILKVRNITKDSNTKLDISEDEEFDQITYISPVRKRSSLSARKSLSRSNVRFEEEDNLSLSEKNNPINSSVIKFTGNEVNYLNDQKNVEHSPSVSNIPSPSNMDISMEETNEDHDDSSKMSETVDASNLPKPKQISSPKFLPNLRPRRSLSRQVLESNAQRSIEKLKSHCPTRETKSETLEETITITKTVTENMESTKRIDEKHSITTTTQITDFSTKNINQLNKQYSFLDSDRDTSDSYIFEDIESPPMSKTMLELFDAVSEDEPDPAPQVTSLKESKFPKNTEKRSEFVATTQMKESAIIDDNQEIADPDTSENTENVEKSGDLEDESKITEYNTEGEVAKIFQVTEEINQESKIVNSVEKSEIIKHTEEQLQVNIENKTKHQQDHETVVSEHISVSSTTSNVDKKNNVIESEVIVELVSDQDDIHILPPKLIEDSENHLLMENKSYYGENSKFFSLVDNSATGFSSKTLDPDINIYDITDDLSDDQSKEHDSNDSFCLRISENSMERKDVDSVISISSSSRDNNNSSRDNSSKEDSMNSRHSKSSNDVHEVEQRNIDYNISNLSNIKPQEDTKSSSGEDGNGHMLFKTIYDVIKKDNLQDDDEEDSNVEGVSILSHSSKDSEKMTLFHGNILYKPTKEDDHLDKEDTSTNESSSVTKKRIPRKRANQSDLDNIHDQSFSTRSLRSRTVSIESEKPVQTTRGLRTRSASVDHVAAESVTKRKKTPLKRGGSTSDIRDGEDKTLNTSKEFAQSLQDYSLTRRMTRAQSKILTTVLENAELETVTKDNFDNLHGTTNTSTPLTPIKRLRSNSNSSDVNTDTPVKPMRQLRSGSSCSEGASVHSQQTSTRQLRSKSIDAVSNSSKKSTTSTTSKKSNKTTKSKSSVSKSKSSKVLPEIVEETLEGNQRTAKRITRTRSSQL